MSVKIKRIDAEERFYEVEGVKMPSVTTILNVISKPALQFWYVKMALEYIRQNHGRINEITVGDILKEARKKPDELKEEAANIGSLVHWQLEKLVKSMIETKQSFQVDVDHFDFSGLTSRYAKPVDEILEKVVNSTKAFVKWAASVKFEPIESELMVYSRRWHYAGTLDCVAKINGKLAVIDFKSSKSYWPEMDLQVSAYRQAYQEMTGRKPKEAWILRLGKEDGEFEAIQVKSLAKSMRAFKGAYELWLWKNAQKND